MLGKGSSNGIDAQRFSRKVLDDMQVTEIKKTINFSVGTIYLLCIGRMVADKGIPELVSVFTSLTQNNTNIKLILVGQYEAELDPLSADTLKQIESNPSIYHINWTDKVECFSFTPRRVSKCIITVRGYAITHYLQSH